MKHKTKLGAFLLACSLFIGSVALASFPVKKVNNLNVASEQIVITKKNVDAKVQAQFKSVSKSDVTKTSVPKGGDNEKLITILLWAANILVWPFAWHRWYAGKPTGWNILFILTCGGCGIWWIVDLINILKDDF